MTYAELKDLIKDMTDEQANMPVQVYVQGLGEFYTLVSDYPVCDADDSIVSKYLVI